MGLFRPVFLVFAVCHGIFSIRNLIAGGRTLQSWENLVQDDALYQAIVISLLLAVFTVVLMLVILVPTMLVRLRRRGPRA